MGPSARSASALGDPFSVVWRGAVLREFDFAVDHGGDCGSTLRWLSRVRYDLVVVGGRSAVSLRAATRLSDAGTQHDVPPRLVLLAERVDVSPESRPWTW